MGILQRLSGRVLRSSSLAVLMGAALLASCKSAEPARTHQASQALTPQGDARWVGSWSTGPQLTEPKNLPPAPGLSDSTLRQYVFPTLSGSRARLRLSNEFGDAPVTFQAVQLAAAAGAGSIAPGSTRAVLFGGSPSLTLADGEARLSDALEFEVSALRSLAITLHFGDVPANVTGHPGSRTTSYLAAGGHVDAVSLPNAATTDHWYFITGLDVQAAARSAAIVTLGDSLTDGRGSTTNANNRWPDMLARRLQARPDTSHLAVLNLGIGGNAVLSGGLGPTAEQRFQRDVLEQRGVRYLILLEGVNDLGRSQGADIAERLIAAYERFIERAHAQGLLVYGVPILPFAGSQYDKPERQQARQLINEWIRNGRRFDAVLDLDAAVRDPQNPAQLLPAYDTGDHLHLSPAGYQAMADAIDLSLFLR
jgi:lysophospholipase L1-like esterase